MGWGGALSRRWQDSAEMAVVLGGNERISFLTGDKGGVFIYLLGLKLRASVPIFQECNNKHVYICIIHTEQI